MPSIEFLKPTDQPTGTKRLLAKLRACLTNPAYNDFRMAVAFAKVGPLLRLATELAAWKAARKTTKVVFGIDQRGTSKQALEFALSEFTETYVAYGGNRQFSPTFHPKIYIFSGNQHAIAFIGSNNLTVGGTETNFESYVSIEMALPADAATLASALGLWQDASQAALQLTPATLGQLVGAGIVPDESRMPTRSGTRGAAGAGGAVPALPAFPNVAMVPPTSIPKQGIVAQIARQTQPQRAGAAAAQQQAGQLPIVAPSIAAQALIIQIIPHHNGEVFLSKRAVDQDPAFFGWPFTGLTVPKKASNAAYPQRVPDPVVNIRVYNAAGNVVVTHNGFNLNTVYYENKSEIRITVPQDVVDAAPEYSVMVMTKANAPLDYEMDIYAPNSPQYAQYLAMCNQTMPSGGRLNPRRFGWL